MDCYNIPKKVNRHVLSAMHYLSSVKPLGTPIKEKEIIDRVRFQMKRLVPVPRLANVIRQSLRNMENLSLVSETSPHQFSYHCDSRQTLLQNSPEQDNLFNQNSFVPRRKRNHEWTEGRANERSGWRHLPQQRRLEDIYFDDISFKSSLNSSSSTYMGQWDYMELSDDEDSLSTLSDYEIQRLRRRLRDEYYYKYRRRIERERRYRRAMDQIYNNHARNERNYRRMKRTSRYMHHGGVRLATSEELARMPHRIKRFASPRIIKQTPSSSYGCCINEIETQEKPQTEVEEEEDMICQQPTLDAAEYIWESTSSTIHSDFEAQFRAEKEKELFDQHEQEPLLLVATHVSNKNETASLNLSTRVDKTEATISQNDLEAQCETMKEEISSDQVSSVKETQPSASGGNLENGNQCSESSSEGYHSCDNIILKYVR